MTDCQSYVIIEGEGDANKNDTAYSLCFRRSAVVRWFAFLAIMGKGGREVLPSQLSYCLAILGYINSIIRMWIRRAAGRFSGSAGASLDVMVQSRSTFDTTHIARSRLAPRPSASPFIRYYAQVAEKPSDRDQDIDGAVDRPGSRAFTPNPRNGISGSNGSASGSGMSEEEKARWAFPTKINPSPYDVLHLSREASKGDIKRHC